MSIIREERIGDCRLILGDCMQVMPLIGPVDAVVTDPPYGIGAHSGTGKYGRLRGYSGDWDARAPDVSWISECNAPAIVWGGNYFDLPPSRAFLIWDKGAGFKGRDFAECEMAWCSFDANARVLQHDPLAKGDYRGGNKVHPTQKPVAVMEWCLGFLPTAKSILDPFMGSGTTLVACAKLGRAAVGIEIDPEYFDIACRRVDEAYRQPDMFIAAPAAPRAMQADMFTPPSASQEGGGN